MWPDRCASSKCRKRSWNKLAAQSLGAVDPLPGPVAGVLHPVSESTPVVDLSALPVADRLAVARAALARVSEPRGELLPPVGVVSAVRVPCPYRDLPNEAGDILGCALDAGHKGRHVPGPKVGDIW